MITIEVRLNGERGRRSTAGWGYITNSWVPIPCGWILEQCLGMFDGLGTQNQPTHGGGFG